jgi:CheY-like chemotaxis protein
MLVALHSSRREREDDPIMREVLLVDDDADIRQAMRFILEDAGYVVSEASDGRPALQRILAARDGLVVLLDLNMPGMDGIALLEEVAARDGLLSRHSIVLLTARAGRTMPLTLANRLSELGVPILSKPFELDDLLQVVERAVTRLR